MCDFFSSVLSLVFLVVVTKGPFHTQCFTIAISASFLVVKFKKYANKYFCSDADEGPGALHLRTDWGGVCAVFYGFLRSKIGQNIW